MAVSYDHYRIFYHVAKYGSFTRAASVLMGSQPNITRAMNDLENELGCRLFLRSNRGVRLTPEGERLYAHVQVAQLQLQAGEAELARGRRLESGFVSVGASETALHGMLLPVLRKYHLTYPGIRIRITNHTTPQALSALKNGEVDLAVVTAPTGAAAPLRETPLVQIQDILIGGPQFAHLAARTLQLRELLEYPLIGLGRDTKTNAFFNALFARQGLVLSPDIEVATSDQILPMVANDLGLGFVPEGFAREALKKGEVFRIPLAQALPLRAICLVTDKSRPLSVAAETLAERIRAAGGTAAQEAEQL